MSDQTQGVKLERTIFPEMSTQTCFAKNSRLNQLEKFLNKNHDFLQSDLNAVNVKSQLVFSCVL